MPKSRIVVIGNRKGGVGKTTVTFNLGHSIRRTGKTVLFVDCDSQGNLTRLCKAKVNTIDEFKAGKVQPCGEGIAILAATKRFPQLGKEIDETFDRLTYFKENLIPLIDGLADFILIDTATEISIININAFCVADTVVIPNQASAFSFEGLSEIREVIANVKKTKNPKLSYHVLLNSTRKGRRLTNASRTSIEKEPNWCGVEIPFRESVEVANARGEPAIDTPEIGEQFKKLAEVILNEQK